MGETQVWQRVFAGPGGPPPQDLGELLRDSTALAARYSRLMEGTTGKRRELLRQLREGERDNAACLLGISQLAGTPMILPAPPPRGREPAVRVLSQCWHQTQKARLEYMARSAEPEYGPVFRILADREAQHCTWIAQLIGNPTPPVGRHS